MYPQRSFSSNFGNNNNNNNDHINKNNNNNNRWSTNHHRSSFSNDSTNERRLSQSYVLSSTGNLYNSVSHPSSSSSSSSSNQLYQPFQQQQQQYHQSLYHNSQQQSHLPSQNNISNHYNGYQHWQTSSISAAPPLPKSSPSYSFNRNSYSIASSNSPTQFSDEDEDDNSTLLSTKRKRIQQACKSCSFRRVKCDGRKPCQTCVKNEEECEYGQPKRRGPPKGSTRGGRKSKDFGQKRIDSNSFASVKPDEINLIKEKNSCLINLDDEENLTNLVIQQLYKEKIKKGKIIENNGDNNDDDDDDLIQFIKIPIQIIDKLFKVFWESISLHWPMFPRELFPTIESIRKMSENDCPLLLNAICSIAALRWDNNRNGGELDSRNSNEALSVNQLSKIFSIRAHFYHLNAISKPSLENCAALVFLSLRETGAGRSNQAIHYCWTACRMAMDLGLHRHSEMFQILGPKIFTPIHDEMRRRIYWSIYVIDKMMAVQLGRPPILRDEESDCPLPSFKGEEHSSKNSSNSLTLALYDYFTIGCKLARISEGIINQYNIVKEKSNSIPKVEDLHNRLIEWNNKTPKSLQWPANELNHTYIPFIIHQQSWMQACRILLHRPYILKLTDEKSGINSHSECSDATEKIFQMFNDYNSLLGVKKAPSTMVYCLFSAATIALANTTSIDEKVNNQAKFQLRTFINWLIELTETWNSAIQHLAILEKLALNINIDLHEIGLNCNNLRNVLKERFTKEGSFKFNSIENNKISKELPLLDSLTMLNARGHESNSLAFPDLRNDSNSNSNSNSNLQFSSFPNSTNSTMTNSSSSTLANATNATIATTTTTTSTTAEEQLQALDAFWPDMPLGEDFQRWISFTQNYFGVTTNPTNGINTISEEQGISGEVV